MSTTEIATLPLYGHKGLNFASQDPEEREAIDFSVKLISRQPGCRNVGYSEKHEDNEVTIMIVDWDTLENHTAFTKNEADYSALTDKLCQAVQISDITLRHFKPRKPVLPALSAPVTEVVYWYFATDSVPADFGDVWENFIQTAVTPATDSGAHAETHGWMVEENVEFKTLQGETLKGKCYVCLIGWESVQHHLDFRQTEAFKTHMPDVRKHISGVEVYHIAIGKGSAKSW